MSDSSTSPKFLIVASSASRRAELSDLVAREWPDAELLEAEHCHAALEFSSQHGTAPGEAVMELAHGRRVPNPANRYLTSQELTFELGNDIEAVPSLIAYLLEQDSVTNTLDDRQIHCIRMALTESLSNAIHHGNLELSSDLRQEDESLYYDMAETRRLQWPYCDRKVFVTASYSRERIKFSIRDEGPGFNTSRVADPTDAEHIELIGGRGLLLIRAFMDEVVHNDRGNQITMIKYVSPGAALLAEMREPHIASAALQPNFA